MKRLIDLPLFSRIVSDGEPSLAAPSDRDRDSASL